MSLATALLVAEQFFSPRAKRRRAPSCGGSYENENSIDKRLDPMKPAARVAPLRPGLLPPDPSCLPGQRKPAKPLQMVKGDTDEPERGSDDSGRE